MSNYDSFLQSNMSHYKYVGEARNSVVPALREYCDLRPCMERFTYPNGDTKSLVALSGTIPVVHKGSTYNIPVCMYMPLGLPHEAPMVYVKPTAAMEIRTSQQVDSNGRIYLPYLSSWTHPQSDVVSLVQMLQIHFGEAPPVVSRPTQRQQHQQQQPQQQQQQPNYGWGAGYGWNQPQQQYPQQYPQYQGQQQQPLPQQQQQHPQGTRQDFNEEALRMSVQSAAEDKVRRRYGDKRAQVQAELDVVRRTGDELGEGKRKLEAMSASLDSEQAKLQAYVVALREKNAEAEDLLTQMQSQEAVSVDDAIDATAPLYRQIFRCFAEEQALEDTIYALGDALKKGSVGFDDYLKNIRDLSRRQFVLRATIHAARTKAGLPEA